MTKTEREIQRKLGLLKYAGEVGDVAKACRYFGVGRASIYRWKPAYECGRESGLANRKTASRNPANRMAAGAHPARDALRSIGLIVENRAYGQSYEQFGNRCHRLGANESNAFRHGARFLWTGGSSPLAT